MRLRQWSRAFLAMCGMAVVLGAPAAAQNWNGDGQVRYGVFLQGSSVGYDIANKLADGSVFRQTASPSALGVGLAAGYDLRLGSFILGGEVDASFDGGGDKAKPANHTQLGVDFFVTARARLGYVVAPGITPYVTFGYALQGVEYKANNLVSSTSSANFKKAGHLPGIVYGGGLEYDIGWGTSFIEYLHQEFEPWDFRGFSGNPIVMKGSQDVVRLGIKFTTGHDHAHNTYRR